MCDHLVVATGIDNRTAHRVRGQGGPRRRRRRGRPRRRRPGSGRPPRPSAVPLGGLDDAALERNLSTRATPWPLRRGSGSGRPGADGYHARRSGCPPRRGRALLGRPPAAWRSTTGSSPGFGRSSSKRGHRHDLARLTASTRRRSRGRTGRTHIIDKGLAVRFIDDQLSVGRRVRRPGQARVGDQRGHPQPRRTSWTPTGHTTSRCASAGRCSSWPTSRDGSTSTSTGWPPLESTSVEISDGALEMSGRDKLEHHRDG